MMTIARSNIVDLSITSWYHLISKTVRGASLLNEGDIDRKQWIEDRLELLAGVFAIDVASFSVLDNHMHLLVNLRPRRIDRWSNQEILRRWFCIHPPRKNRMPVEITSELLNEKSTDKKFVRKIRKRLANLGWFMKSLKEPIARLSNKTDDTTGAFWQSRYKSIAILDNDALLAVSAYIDLNVFAAGMADRPENSPHTSLRIRFLHCHQQGRIEDLKAAGQSSVAGVNATEGLEDGTLWLCPIEDRRHLDEFARPGFRSDFSLGSYLQLVDWTSRLAREGKAQISQHAEDLLGRLGTTTDGWGSTLRKLFTKRRHTGVAFSFHRSRLRDVARQRGKRYVANLDGCIS